MMRPITTAFAVTAAALTAHAGAPIAWTNAAGGFWDVAANWTPAAVPAAANDVFLGLADPYTVNVRISQTAGSLLISNPAARLDVSAFRNLSMFGPVENHGTITINPTQVGAEAQFRFENTATLSGTGTLNLAASANLSQLSAGAAGVIVTQAAGHEIIGHGQISAAMVNDGTISATVPAAALQVFGPPKVNNALMRAVNAGVLRLNNTTINQSPQGIILADGPNSRVDLVGVAIDSGTVRGQNGGVATVAIDSAFNNVRTEGDIEVQAFRTLNVQGALTNAGSLRLNPTQIGAAAVLRFQDGSTLTGSGQVDLAANATLSELTTATDASMTHAAGHTIRGLGRVSASMTNNGRINADINAERMQITGPAKTNNSLIHATNGGILDLIGTTVNNGPNGVIRAENASRVELQNVTITAGVLESTGTGRVVSTLDSTLNSVETSGNIDVMVFRTMNINGTQTNKGTISVNPTQAGASANLRFASGSVLTGNGSVHLVANATLSQINTDPGSAMTHAAGHTIRGRGQINALMTNNGLITANETDGTMTLTGATKTNNSLIQSTNTGTLLLTSTTINNGPAGIIRAGNDSRVDLQNVTINAGILESIGSGRVVSVLDSVINGVETRGNIDVMVFRTMSVDGSLNNNGTISVNPTQAGASANLRFADGSVLSGNGSVHLVGSATLSQINTDAGDSMIHAAGHTIRGQGQINAGMTNNGLITANQPGGTMTFAGQTKTNNSLTQAVNGARLLLQSLAVDQSANGTILADGAGSIVELNNATVNAGTLDTANGGVILVTNGNATIAEASIDGFLQLDVFRTLTLQPGTTLNGRIITNPSQAGASAFLRWDETFELGGNGTITLFGNASLSDLSAEAGATPILGPGIRLEGIGRINAPTTIRGTVAPGNSGIGTINAARSVTLTPTSIFEAQIAAPTTADRLSSTSSFVADGTLEIELVNGFDPSGYWTSTIITATQGVSGQFETIIAPPPTDTRLAIRAVYLPNEIRIGAYCKADFNADGLLNFFDISLFIAEYNAGSPAADIAAPFGILNFFDIAAYIARYNQGCP